MTDVQINIDRRHMGFQYESVKSLLEEFEKISTAGSSVGKITINLNIEKKDFHELSFALIWRLASFYKKHPCKQKHIKYAEEISDSLVTRHFLERLTGSTSQSFDDNIPIDYETFSPHRSTSDTTSDSAVDNVLKRAKKTILNANNEFHSELENSILEIINNVFDHSEAKDEAAIICVKGADSDHLSVCTVDMGQGIKKSFLSNPFLKKDYAGMREEDVIENSTKHKVSCNPSVARHPNYKNTSNGGIGLFYLKELVKTHQGGQLVLISGKGYYYIDCNGVCKKRNFTTIAWPGTLVFFRIKLNQNLSERYKDLVQSI